MWRNFFLFTPDAHTAITVMFVATNTAAATVVVASITINIIALCRSYFFPIILFHCHRRCTSTTHTNACVLAWTYIMHTKIDLDNQLQLVTNWINGKESERERENTTNTLILKKNVYKNFNLEGKSSWIRIENPCLWSSNSVALEILVKWKVCST